MNQLSRCLEILKNNTDKGTGKLSNTASLEVMVAATKLLEKGNESYLKQYQDYANGIAINNNILSENKIKEAIDNIPF